MKDNTENYHLEIIKCPECNAIQHGKVVHSTPFNSYVHFCVECNYIILESEWQQVKKVFVVTDADENVIGAYETEELAKIICKGNEEYCYEDHYVNKNEQM